MDGVAAIYGTARGEAVEKNNQVGTYGAGDPRG